MVRVRAFLRIQMRSTATPPRIPPDLCSDERIRPEQRGDQNELRQCDGSPLEEVEILIKIRNIFAIFRIKVAQQRTWSNGLINFQNLPV